MVLNGLVVFGLIPTVREWTLDLSEPVQIELSHYFIYSYTEKMVPDRRLKVLHYAKNCNFPAKVEETLNDKPEGGRI